MSRNQSLEEAEGKCLETNPGHKRKADGALAAGSWPLAAGSLYAAALRGERARVVRARVGGRRERARVRGWCARGKGGGTRVGRVALQHLYEINNSC